MTFLEAAYEILKRAGEPLHYTEITARALAAGLLDTRGQTPDATMGSRLYVDTKRPDTRFRRVGRGVFALLQPQPSDIPQRIDALNNRVRAQLRKRLLRMPPDRFEALTGELLIALGFDEATVEVTSHSGDGGIDVRGVLRASGITEVNAADLDTAGMRKVAAWLARRLALTPLPSAPPLSLPISHPGVAHKPPSFWCMDEADCTIPSVSSPSPQHALCRATPLFRLCSSPARGHAL
jgi:hypothetical protein